MSWDPVVATKYHEDFDSDVVWSPCSRLIAVIKRRTVEVLDAVTLNRLNTFKLSPFGNLSSACSFSPDTRFLTKIDGGALVSWDLQTGTPVRTHLPELDLYSGIFSATYSPDRNMFAVAYRSSDGVFINTYDLLSGTHKGPHRISGGRVINLIWTHSDSLRFATTQGGCITIWEVAFTLQRPPAEVASFPAPDGTDDAQELLLLLTPPRLALTFEDKVSVWDLGTSKFLLESGPIPVSDAIAPPPPSRFGGSSFSSSGRFFASMTNLPEAYVWRESPTGYTLHQRLVFTGAPRAFQDPQTSLSPNGESIIVNFNNTIRLWPTADQIPHPSSIPTEQKKNGNYPFIRAFSPNETLAAFARTEGNVVTVLDLQSGDPRVVIDTGMRVGCLGVAESTVVVVGKEGRIVTWSLPAGNDTLNSRATITNNIQLQPIMPAISEPKLFSISPDLSRVAISTSLPLSHHTTHGVYDASTGKCLVEVMTTRNFRLLFFTPDGREIWGVHENGEQYGWEILQDSNKLGCTELKASRFPQGFPCGYGVTGDGWVRGSTQKRLLWLPHYWRLGRWDITWSGRYLGLGYPELPEVVILEFLECKCPISQLPQT